MRPDPFWTKVKSCLLAFVFGITTLFPGYAWAGWGGSSSFSVRLGLEVDKGTYRILYPREGLSLSRSEVERLFETFLRIPPEILWVNLSPGYPPLPPELLHNPAGRLLLAMDYQFKRDIETILLRRLVAGDVEGVIDFPFFWVEPARGHLEGQEDRFFVSQVKVRVKFKGGSREYADLYSQVARDLEEKISTDPAYRRLREAFAVYLLANHLKRRLSRRGKKVLDSKKSPLRGVEVLGSWLYDDDPSEDPYEWKRAYLDRFFSPISFSFRGKKFVKALGGMRFKQIFSWLRRKEVEDRGFLRSSPVPIGYQDIRPAKEEISKEVLDALERELGMRYPEGTKLELVDVIGLRGERWVAILYDYLADRTITAYGIRGQVSAVKEETGLPLPLFKGAIAGEFDDEDRIRLCGRVGELFTRAWIENGGNLPIKTGSLPLSLIVVKKIDPSAPIAELDMLDIPQLENGLYLSDDQTVDLFVSTLDALRELLGLEGGEYSYSVVNAFFGAWKQEPSLRPLLRGVAKRTGTIITWKNSPNTGGVRGNWGDRLRTMLLRAVRFLKDNRDGAILLLTAVLGSAFFPSLGFLPILGLSVKKKKGKRAGAKTGPVELVPPKSAEELRALLADAPRWQKTINKLSPEKLANWIDSAPISDCKDAELFYLWVTRVAQPFFLRGEVIWEPAYVPVYSALVRSFGRFKLEEMESNNEKLDGIRLAIAMMVLLGTKVEGETLDLLATNLARFLVSYNATAVDLNKWKHRASAFSNAIDLLLDERIRSSNTYEAVLQEIAKGFFEVEGAVGVDDLLKSKVAVEILDGVKDFRALLKEDLPTATEWLTMVFASRPEAVREEWIKAFTEKSTSQQRLIRLPTGMLKFWMDLARVRGGEVGPSKIDEFSFELSQALTRSNNPGIAQAFTISLKEDPSAVARMFLGVARKGGIGSLIQFLVYLVKNRAINEEVIAEAIGSAKEDELGVLEGGQELIVRAWSATLLEIGRVDVLRPFSETYWQEDPFLCSLRFAGLLGEGMFADLNRDLSSLTPDQKNRLIGQIKRLFSQREYRKYRMLYSSALVLLQGDNWVSALKDRLDSVDEIGPEEEVFLADLLEAVIYRLDRAGPADPKDLNEVVESVKRLSSGFSFTYPGVTEPLLILLWWLDRSEEVRQVVEKALTSKSAKGIPRDARKALEGIRSILKGKAPAFADLKKKGISAGLLPSLMLVMALERFGRWDRREEIESYARYAGHLLASDLRAFRLYGRAFKALASSILASRNQEKIDVMEERLDSLARDLSGILDLPEEDLPWFVVKDELIPVLEGIEGGSAWSRMVMFSYLSFVVGELAVNNKEEFWAGLKVLLSKKVAETLIPAIGLTAITALERPADEVLSRGIIDSKEVKGWLVDSLVRYAKTFSFTKPKQWKKRKGEFKWLEDSLKGMVEFSRGKADLVRSVLEESRSKLESERVDLDKVPLVEELKDLIASKEKEEEKVREEYGPLIEALNKVTERVSKYTKPIDPELKTFKDYQQLYLAKAREHLPKFNEDWLEAWRETNPLGSSYIVVKFYSGKESVKELNIPNGFPLELFKRYEIDWGKGKIVDRIELAYHQIRGLPLKVSMDLRWLREFLNNLDQYLSLWEPNLKSPPEVVLPRILAKYLERPRQRASDRRRGQYFELQFSQPVNRLPDKFKATRALLTSLYLELHGDGSVVATDSLLRVADLLRGYERMIWEGIEKRKPFLNKLKKLGLKLGENTKIAVVGAQIGGRYMPVIVWLEPHPLGGQWVPRMVIYGARVEIFDGFGIATQLLDKVLKVSLVAVPVSKALNVRKTVSWIGLKGGLGKPIIDSVDPIFKITRNWELDYMQKAMYCIALPEDEERDYRYYLVLANYSRAFCLCKVPKTEENITFLDALSYIEKSTPYDPSWWREIKKISFANAAGGKKMLLASSLVEKFFRDYPIHCEWVMLRMPKWMSLSGLWAQPKRVDIDKYIVVSRILEKEKRITIDFYEQITPVVGSMILRRGVDLLRDKEKLSYAFSLDFLFSKNGMQARLYRKDKDEVSISSFLGWEEVNKFVFGNSEKRELVLSPARLFPDYAKPVQSGKFVKTRHPVFANHQSAFSFDFGGYKCGFAKSVYWGDSPLYELLKDGSCTMKGLFEENAGPDIKITFYLKREDQMNWEEVLVILVDRDNRRFRVISKHPNLDIICTPGQWKELGESTFMWFKGEDKDKVKVIEYHQSRKTYYEVGVARLGINVRRVLPWWLGKEVIFKVEKESENKRVIKLIKRQGKANPILGKVTVESFPDLGKRVVFDSRGNKICEFPMKRKQYDIRIEDLFPRVNDAFPVFAGLPSSREIIERANYIRPSNRLRGIGSLSIGPQAILHITVSSKSKDSMEGELARIFDMGAFVFFYPNSGIVTFAVPAIDLEIPVARIVKRWKQRSILFLWHLPSKNYNPLRKLSSYKAGPKHHGPPAIVISLYSLLPLAPKDPKKSQEWAQMYLKRLRETGDFSKQELERFYLGILKFFSIYYTGSGMVPVESWPILFRAKMIPGWKDSYNFTLLPHYSGIAEFFEDKARVSAYRKFLRNVIVVNPRVFSQMVRAGVHPERFGNKAHYARWRTALCVLSMLTGDEEVKDVLLEYYLKHGQDFEHDARISWEFEEKFVGKGMRPDERELVKNAAENLSKFYRTLDTRFMRMRWEEKSESKLNSFALFLLPLTLNGIKHGLLQASLFSFTPLLFPAVIGLTGWYVWKRLSQRRRRVLTSDAERTLFRIGSTISRTYPRYRSQIYRILRSNDTLRRKAENLALHLISHMGPYGERLRLEALSSLSPRLSSQFLYDLANLRIRETYYDPFEILDILAREKILGFVSAWSGVPLSYQLLSEKVSRASAMGSKVLFNLLSFNPKRWDRLGIGSRYPFIKEYLSQLLKRKGRNLVRKVDYAVNFLWELRYLFGGEERSAMFSVVEAWRTRFYPVKRVLQPSKRTRLPVKGGVVFYE